ncbi:MAG: PAS domain S-box protein [Desulfomonile tiedjei]|uniref:histidine kinase n=1 Tax=Desulfomonile tiedjei TaxID=2358 RepID=A0A9D6V2I7_9BACT|nr:PAS domain S-box protein [Desulfomonile tiedjei]
MKASRILIVEDELILADDIAHLLKSWGHEVVSIVSSGEEAIRKADETCPDLVLMDIVLEGQMDGIEAAGYIKSQVEAAIVYLTAHSKKDLFERAKITEPFGYLSKPVSPEELEGTVEMALYKHKMEKQLRENEEKFRAVFENSFDAMLLTESDGQVLEANSAAARMLGRTKEELYRIGLDDFVDVSDPRLTAALEERDRTGRFMGELYLKRNDGAPFPAEVSSVVFLDSKGEKRVCDVVRDITGRKLSDEALKESEERYRKLVDLAPDGIHVSVGEIFAFANDAMAGILGVKRPDDLVGRNIFDFVHPDYCGVVRDRFKRIMSDGIPLVTEEKYVRPDGTEVEVEVAATRLTYQGRQAAQVVVRDITYRKRAEEALRESQEKYRMVVENANEAIVVARNGFATFANGKAEEIIGCSAETLRSVPFNEFIHPNDRESVTRCYHRRLSGESVSSPTCFRVIHSDGSAKWVEQRAVLINWEDCPATLNFLYDITERKKIEEELIKLEKLQSVGLLAGGIAHDFNNILTAIMGNISLAKVCTFPGDKIHERLSLAEKSCLRAQGLTKQLLTFSSGGAPVTKVSDIAGVAKGGCIAALCGSDVACEFNFPDDLWLAQVDEGQISQVFGNLLLNAIQAMPGGGSVCVTGCNVTVTEEDRLPIDPGDYLRVSVADQGIGISREHITRIFDPYFTTKCEARGLGLATAYAIINRHGGMITVDSRLEVGTTFHVYLPASKNGVQAQTDLDDLPVFGKGRVLIMDDEEPIRRLAQDVLSFLGYEVAVAEHGEQAISLYAKAKDSSDPFDVVILDLTVPGGMGGIEVVKALREVDPDIKAIVSSGYSSDPVMADHRKHLFQGVVSKPYTVRELSQVLKRVIEE